MAVVGATAGLSAWLVKPVLDDVFIRHDEWQLRVLPLVILGLYLLKGGCRYLQSYLMRWVGEAVILQMRGDLLRHLQFREVAFYDRNPTGALIARVISDVEAMHRAIPDLAQLLRHAFTMTGLLVVLFSRDWRLTVLSLVVFPLAGLPARRISVLRRRYARKGQERIGELANVLQEAFSGIHVVKTFRCEDREIGRFQAEGERLRQVRLKSARINEATAPFMEFLGALGVALIIFWGGRQVLSGATTPGSFFSFLTALFMMYDPLKKVGRFNNSFQRALAAAERVFEVMDEPVASCERGGDHVLGRSVTEVVFDDVRFSYDATKGEVLRGVSARAGRGEVVALVGASGAGKSTVLKLLPRFHDPTSGMIRVNGRDIKEYTLESLRGSVSVVTQDTFLFNDTVRHNLFVGRPEATNDELVAATKAAHAHGFVEAFPAGYDTVVGERGDLLSGGQ
jgi:subfamily B ATP-binding cassette protein MsbA